MRFRVFVVLGSSLAVTFASRSAHAQTTWYVDVNATPPGSGTQVDPYASIEYAISRPTTLNGDAVLVAPGTYFEHVDFLGKAIRVASSSGAASTMIDANGVGSVVKFASGETSGATLSGFTLRNGQGTVMGSNFAGGGIYCNGSSPTLIDLVVQDNAAWLGGGMYFENSNALLVLCTIQDNQDNLPIRECCAYGAGVYVACGVTPVFDTCTFRHNRPDFVQAGGGIFGGGYYHNCTIADNWAFEGGGIHGSMGCPPEFVGCLIKGNQTNSAFADSSSGGGVYGPATLTNCTITGNRGRFNGGGAFNCTLIGCELAGNTVDYVPSASPTSAGHGGGAASCVLSDCNVHDNVALGFSAQFIPSGGGGIILSTATRCRIWHNSADRGAGAATSTLENCTVYGNTAAHSGGAYTLLFVGSTSTIHNSILWNNLPDEIDATHPAPVVTYCDVTGGYAGIGNIALDPLLWAPLTGDFHLKAGSPCIDTGDPSEMDADSSRIDMGVYPFDRNYCGPYGTYCSAKVNSHGCAPAISSNGTPSLSGADNFFVTATQELNQRSGILIWSLTPASQIALGGILCVSSFKRTPSQNSGGSGMPTIDCSGSYSYFFSHAYMNAHAITVGKTVYAQYYGRDPFIPDGTGASLSNAIEFTVCP